MLNRQALRYLRRTLSHVYTPHSSALDEIADKARELDK